MSFSGSGGYVMVNGEKQAGTLSWSMRVEQGGVIGLPGADGADVFVIDSEVKAAEDKDFTLQRGQYVELVLCEGGKSTIAHKLIECQVQSISYSGAAPNSLVMRSVQFESRRAKEIVNAGSI